MRWRQCELHKTVASSFGEVKVQCLSFPGKGVKVEEMIDWVVGEVKVVPDIVWRLNDNFVVLAIENVLNTLNDEGCQGLNRVCNLATSRDIAILKDVSEDMHKLAGPIV
jgi:hypothetical protein